MYLLRLTAQKSNLKFKIAIVTEILSTADYHECPYEK